MKYRLCFVILLSFFFAPIFAFAAACDGVLLSFINETDNSIHVTVQATKNSTLKGGDLTTSFTMHSNNKTPRSVFAFTGDGSGGSATGYITWKDYSTNKQTAITYEFDSPLSLGGLCFNNSDTHTSGGWAGTDKEIIVTHGHSGSGTDSNVYTAKIKD